VQGAIHLAVSGSNSAGLYAAKSQIQGPLGYGTSRTQPISERAMREVEFSLECGRVIPWLRRESLRGTGVKLLMECFRNAGRRLAVQPSTGTFAEEERLL